MRILSLSASDWRGGAARVAFYLTHGLCERGIDADMLVLDKVSSATFSRELPARVPHPLLNRVSRRFSLNAVGLFSPKWRDALSPKTLAQYDLLHLHDVPGMNLPQLWRTVKMPMVWTHHSMYALTGNCTYAMDCDRWQKRCGNCPQFGTWPLIYQRRDASAQVMTIKRALYPRMRFHAVGVSQWMTDQIAKSAMASQPRHTIPNPSWRPDFYQIDRQAARKRLGIPDGAVALLFSVAGKTDDVRKGLDIILEAVRQIQITWPDAERLFLLPTGITPPDGSTAERMRSLPGLPPRHLTETDALRDYYSAADAIWHPSRADNSPLVILEAFGCGTPVIASAVGGVPETVQHERSGLLIPPDDPAALVAATRRFADDPALQARLRAGALEVAAEHAPERFVSDYLEVYEQAIADHAAGRHTA